MMRRSFSGPLSALGEVLESESEPELVTPQPVRASAAAAATAAMTRMDLKVFIDSASLLSSGANSSTLSARVKQVTLAYAKKILFIV
ncbi:hypothetical protein GCM10010525_21450 [Glutamicibacter bergerei]|uniref:Uncharacterized protein n=1 Tax=Glutamicibacter ardleyensis TaxID=225894 RepID=A0ABQ2DGA8_9MICC|nr:hypothetical protein GCM10007173_14780 [Glutamicibacter ardleyensis]